MSKKLIVTDNRGERELLLVNSTVVGRDPTCEISVDDPLLSWRHAEFTLSGGQAYVRDLDSRNGVIVNGQSLTSPMLLSTGDAIEIAALRIVFVDDGDVVTVNDDNAPEDATVVLLPPDGGTLVPRRSARAERRVAPPRQQRAAPPRSVTSPAGSWQARLLVYLLTLAVFVLFTAVLPLLVWHGRVLGADGTTRARVLADWLAADAAIAIQTSGDFGAVGQGVAREQGVVSAVVFAPDGRVLAPMSRATEVFTKVPGTNARPADLVAAQVVEHGDDVDVFVPVDVQGRGRRAIAWLRFRPSAPPESPAALVVLGPALLFALGGAALVAAVIWRTTARAMTSFNQDIEKALAGQLEAVGDPLGLRSFRDLTDTVNYLIARVRATATRGPNSAVPMWPAPRSHSRPSTFAGPTSKPGREV